MSGYISLLVFVLCVVSTYGTKVVDINTICKNEDFDYSFCINLLKSKQGADLLILARFTIDVLHTETNKTVELIKTLIHQYDKDPEAESHYTECFEYFGGTNGAVSDFEIIEERMKDGDYYGMREHVLFIVTDCDTCTDGAGPDPSRTPYPDKSVLPNYIKVVRQVGLITYTISTLLMENV